MMLDRLMRDHMIMREKAEALLLLLECDVMPPSEVLADARWQLSSHIMQHLAFEDRHLYAKLLGDRRAHVADTGRRFQADLAELFSSYAQHAQYWTPEVIARDWNGFRSASRLKTYEMFARMDREESELYPLVQDADIDIHSNAAPTTNWARDAFVLKDAMHNGSHRPAG